MAEEEGVIMLKENLVVETNQACLSNNTNVTVEYTQVLVVNKTTVLIEEGEEKEEKVPLKKEKTKEQTVGKPVDDEEESFETDQTPPPPGGGQLPGTNSDPNIGEPTAKTLVQDPNLPPDGSDSPIGRFGISDKPI